MQDWKPVTVSQGSLTQDHSMGSDSFKVIFTTRETGLTEKGGQAGPW